MKIYVSTNDPRYKEAADNMNKIMDEMSKRFEEMDQAFKDMDAKLSSIDASDWKTYTLLLPKKIGKRWYWPGREVYRKRTVSSKGVQWIYGTEFDVLKDSK